MEPLWQPDYRGLLEPRSIRPLRLRQARDGAAGFRRRGHLCAGDQPSLGRRPVAEATGIGAATKLAIGGLKPEGGVAWEAVNVLIRTFAEWVPVTRRAIACPPSHPREGKGNVGIHRDANRQLRRHAALSDQRSSTRLLIRRFGVQVPGAHRKRGRRPSP